PDLDEIQFRGLVPELLAAAVRHAEEQQEAAADRDALLHRSYPRTERSFVLTVALTIRSVFCGPPYPIAEPIVNQHQPVGPSVLTFTCDRDEAKVAHTHGINHIRSSAKCPGGDNSSIAPQTTGHPGSGCATDAGKGIR